MTDKVQKIREEVERLKSNLIHGACASQIAMETRCKEEAYDEVISLLDSLQEEPVSKQNLSNVQRTVKNCKELGSEDLNTASKVYADNITDKIGYKLQLRRAVVYGAKWQMAQMIKDATDVTVHVDAGGYPYIPQMELYDYDNDVPIAKEGDRYKVVLIKED